jgi:hypothetical protein
MIAQPTSRAPVLTAPALSVDFQVSLLTLIDDYMVLTQALDTAGQLQARAQSS